MGTGGAAAPILAGVVAGVGYDAVTTGIYFPASAPVSHFNHFTSGIESARHGKYDPQGYVSAASEISQDWRSGSFDIVAIGAMDGYLNKGRGTTKVCSSLTYIYSPEHDRCFAGVSCRGTKLHQE